MILIISENLNDSQNDSPNDYENDSDNLYGSHNGYENQLPGESLIAESII